MLSAAGCATRGCAADGYEAVDGAGDLLVRTGGFSPNSTDMSAARAEQLCVVPFHSLRYGICTRPSAVTQGWFGGTTMSAVGRT